MENATRALWGIFTEMGVPKNFQLDNGPEFVNKLIKQFMKLYGIDQRFIKAYNLQPDRLVKRKNKKMDRILKKHLRQTMDQWHTWLPITKLSLNLKILERKESKPFKLFYRKLFIHSQILPI